MAQPKRNDVGPDHVSAPWPASAPGDYHAGGPVGWMQAELAQRLARGARQETTAERVIRVVSVASGVGLLLAAYACVAAAILWR